MMWQTHTCTPPFIVKDIIYILISLLLKLSKFTSHLLPDKKHQRDHSLYSFSRSTTSLVFSQTTLKKIWIWFPHHNRYPCGLQLSVNTSLSVSLSPARVIYSLFIQVFNCLSNSVWAPPPLHLPIYCLKPRFGVRFGSSDKQRISRFGCS